MVCWVRVDGGWAHLQHCLLPGRSAAAALHRGAQLHIRLRCRRLPAQQQELTLVHFSDQLERYLGGARRGCVARVKGALGGVQRV
jgi:hypothetical protein